MTHDQEVCLKLGGEIVRMIRDLRDVSGPDTGYARRQFTFPGGAVQVLIVKDVALVEVMEDAADKAYHVQSATPPSEKN